MMRRLIALAALMIAGAASAAEVNDPAKIKAISAFIRNGNVSVSATVTKPLVSGDHQHYVLISCAHGFQGKIGGTVPVTIPKQKPYAATLRYHDPQGDVAGLDILTNDKLPYTEVSQIPPEIGTAVVTAGYPGGQGPKWVESRISRVTGVSLLNLDTGIFGGHSGGGLFVRGYLVGVASTSDRATSSQFAHTSLVGRAYRQTVQRIAADCVGCRGAGGKIAVKPPVAVDEGQVVTPTVPTPVVKEGPPGLAGRDGKDGKDGKDGVVTDEQLIAIIKAIRDQIKDGKDGRDGVDGLPGKPGPNGTDGSPGAPGLNGKAATIKIGNVASGPVAVVNLGDELNAVLDITIPNGEAGEVNYELLATEVLKRLPPFFIGAKDINGKITMLPAEVRLGNTIFIHVAPPALNEPTN